jgi:hypothetical protein
VTFKSNNCFVVFLQMKTMFQYLLAMEILLCLTFSVWDNQDMSLIRVTIIKRGQRRKGQRTGSLEPSNS